MVFAPAFAFRRTVSVPQDKTIEPRQVTAASLRCCASTRFSSDLDADAFEQLCRYAKPATLKRGATIFSKGDPGNSLIAVISGTVKISISSPDGRNAILNLIGPGETFGEVAVLDGQARTADATANSNCEIFRHRPPRLPAVREQPAGAGDEIHRTAMYAAALDLRPGRRGHPAGSAGPARQRAYPPDRAAQGGATIAAPSPSPSRKSARWSACRARASTSSCAHGRPATGFASSTERSSCSTSRIVAGNRGIWRRGHLIDAINGRSWPV